jgi:hypothetical protein
MQNLPFVEHKSKKNSEDIASYLDKLHQLGRQRRPGGRRKGAHPRANPRVITTLRTIEGQPATNATTGAIF